MENNELVANWNFNSGEGEMLYDDSGNDNHATIHGATWLENIYGCTDSAALNYDSEASINDNSCTYPGNGDYSLSFDGLDDWVQMDHPQYYEFGYNDFTIEFIASWEVSSENFEQEIGIHPQWGLSLIHI